MSSFFEQIKKYLAFMNPDTTPYLSDQLESVMENSTHTGSEEQIPKNNIESALNELSTKEKDLNSEQLHIPNTLDKQNKEHTR